MKMRVRIIKNSYKLVAELLQRDQKKDSHYPNSFGIDFFWGRGGRN